MWWLLFPDIFYHILLWIGVGGTIAGFVFSFVPLIKQYAFPIQVMGVLVLTLGVYFQGAISYKNKFEKEIIDVKIKLAAAQAQGERINTIIVNRVVTKREVVRERGETVVQFIDREVVKYNDRCEIPKEAIISHNAAAENKSIDEYLSATTVINTADHNAQARGRK